MYYYGHFYNLRTTDNRLLRCRSVLEITNQCHRTPNVLLNQQPDAVVVMMNPGSSRPLQMVNQQILEPENIRAHCRLVLTRPDNTQHTVRQIMAQMDYQHIRVLNLSDLCQSKSAKFFNTLRREETIQHNGIQAPHSIFSQCRAEELRYRMNPCGRIVIAGWGKGWNRSNWKRCFANKCYNKIRQLGFHIIGYQDADIPDYIFVHPYYSRIKQIWPNCIVSQIRENLRNR